MTAALALLAVSLLSAEPAVDVYAVVIGHNGGRVGLPALRFADDDALRLARTFAALPGHQQTWVLTRPDPSTQTLLEAAGLTMPATQAPTRSALFATRDALKARLLARAAGRKAVVYLFYAGHGVDGRLLLEPEEGAPEADISGPELKLLAASLPADDVVLFVDACRAQSLFTSRGASGPDLSQRISQLEDSAAHTRLGVLAAAQSDQPAGETDRLQGGFFSHVLASGLLGGADADGDEVVRFGELAAFVAFHTERLTGQRPWFEPPGGELRAATVQLHGATWLRLGAEVEGRLQISSVSGAPFFAEVNKARGKALRLALPVGIFRVTRSTDSGHSQAQVELMANAERGLEADAFAADSAVAERGADDQGFDAPFSASVVAALDSGYVSGRPSPLFERRWRHSLDVAYELSPPPFGLTGLEQGVELGYRFAIGDLLVGPRLSFRSAGFASGGLRRFGALFHVGYRWQPVDWLELSPWVGVGFKSIWVEGARAAAAPFSPGLGGGVRASLRILPRVALFCEGRYEVAWVAIDGARQAYGEPALLVGVSLWL